MRVWGLYHESEMAAIQSCGVGPAGLFRPNGVLGAAIAALLIWLSFWAIPAATARAQQFRVEALRDAQFGALEPGRFRTFGGGKIVFYAERVDDNRVLHNVNVFVSLESRAAQQDGDLGRDARLQRGAGQADQLHFYYGPLHSCRQRCSLHPFAEAHPDPPAIERHGRRD